MLSACKDGGKGGGGDSDFSGSSDGQGRKGDSSGNPGVWNGTSYGTRGVGEASRGTNATTGENPAGKH